MDSEEEQINKKMIYASLILSLYFLTQIGLFFNKISLP